MVVAHDTFPKNGFFPTATFAAELRRFRHRSQGKQPLFKHLHFLGHFTLLFHRLPSQRDNCVN